MITVVGEKRQIKIMIIQIQPIKKMVEAGVVLIQIKIIKLIIMELGVILGKIKIIIVIGEITLITIIMIIIKIQI